MKTKLLLLVCLAVAACQPALAQISPSNILTLSIDPTIPICPNLPGGTTFTISSDNFNSNWYLDNAKNVSIVSNIDDEGNFTVTLADAAGAHSVGVYSPDDGGDIVTITFTASTLAGVTPKFTVPPSHPIPNGYGDVVQAPLCSTTPISYTGPAVLYQANGTSYGVSMTTYDWLVPKGWTINGQAQSGTTPIQTTGPVVTIVPDPINGGGTGTNGEIQFWALNNCNPTLATSSHFLIAIARPVVSLTANPTSINCGSSDPVTFTLNNPASCITGYKWNLSPTSGWLYNNATPTGPVTTTTNTITLTPDITQTQQAVSVTLVGVTTVSGTFKTTVGINAISPAPTSISGATQICGTTPYTYTVQGLPAGSGTSTFTFNTANVIGTLPYTTSGNSITVTNTSSATGRLILTASTPTPCGTSTTPVFDVDLGAQAPTLIGGVVNGARLQSNGTYTFTCYPGPGNIIAYNWSINPAQVISGQGTTQITVKAASTNPGQIAPFIIRVREQDATCGWSPFLIYNCTISSGPGGLPPPPRTARLSPNPATDQVTIVMDNGVAIDAQSVPSKLPGQETQPAPVIKMVRVYDAVGKLRKTVVFSGASWQQQFHVNDLPSGIYFIEVYTDTDKVTQKMIVKH